MRWMNQDQAVLALVVGGTGALGRPVVRLLRERGVAVRVLCRHPEQAPDLAAAGAEMMAGDLTDSQSLQRACAGASHVLAAAHGFTGRGRWRSKKVDDLGHRTLIAAARQSGVRRFVYMSAYGAGPQHPVDFFRTKHAIELAVAESGLDHVILRPTAFMEHHVHLFNGKAVLDKGKAQLIGTGVKARNFVCAADVARFAVRALMEDPPPFRRLDIGGPGHHSNGEVAELYARVAGIEPRASRLPSRVAAMVSILARPLHPGLARVMGMLSLPDDAYSERFEGAADLERDHGVRLTRLEDFVRAQVAAHQAS